MLYEVITVPRVDDRRVLNGIFWCLGRYDRAWGPERPIFGKIRYMSSDSARRKLRLVGAP